MTLLSAWAAGIGTAKVVTYPGPEGEPASPDYTIEVNGKPVFCYKVAVWDPEHGKVGHTSMAYFDFEGAVTVKVKARREVNNVTIRPLAYNIKPSVKGNVISFTLDKPCKITIELNKSASQPLHLFANPLEDNPPQPGDKGVRYFGPGIHEVGPIELKSDETLYIAGGAILRGIILPEEQPTRLYGGGASEDGGKPIYKHLISTYEARNVKIMGRGIIDGSKMTWPNRHTIQTSFSSDILIEGIIITDMTFWTVVLDHCDNVTVSNIKEIGHYINGDGINVCNSRDILIEDCFIRNYDDSICMKTYRMLKEPCSEYCRQQVESGRRKNKHCSELDYLMRNTKRIKGHASGQELTVAGRPVRNVTVKDCVIWNDLGGALGARWESRADIHNVLFTNCHIINSSNPLKGLPTSVLSVLVGDPATVSNIRFEDIVIERAANSLIGLTIQDCPWSSKDGLGNIRNIYFKNITVLGESPSPSQIFGSSPNSMVEDVTFENFRIGGKVIRSAEEGNFKVGKFTRNITFSTKEGG